MYKPERNNLCDFENEYLKIKFTMEYVTMRPGYNYFRIRVLIVSWLPINFGGSPEHTV